MNKHLPDNLLLRIHPMIALNHMKLEPEPGTSGQEGKDTQGLERPIKVDGPLGATFPPPRP